MYLFKRVHVLITAVSLLMGCTAGETPAAKPPGELSKMRTEFIDHCQNRPDHKAKKRAGTLEKYCSCIFKTTMRGLTQNEQLIAAFYLYGEKDDAFRQKIQTQTPNFDGMGTAAEAIEKAVKRCR